MRRLPPPRSAHRDGVIISVSDDLATIRCADAMRPLFVTARAGDIAASTRVRVETLPRDPTRCRIREILR
jgi:hypothetical protein